ncbi:MAG: InlB B-repeat-containing protein [Clostridia bacterium]|nr:InlB B-repeat-containing protein [Clostridia bacterium]
MFKKKFRSLAIVALSFLMVVSFGVGISTFDTKYTASAANGDKTFDLHLSSATITGAKTVYLTKSGTSYTLGTVQPTGSANYVTFISPNQNWKIGDAESVSINGASGTSKNLLTQSNGHSDDITVEFNLLYPAKVEMLIAGSADLTSSPTYSYSFNSETPSTKNITKHATAFASGSTPTDFMNYYKHTSSTGRVGYVEFTTAAAGTSTLVFDTVELVGSNKKVKVSALRITDMTPAGETPAATYTVTYNLNGGKFNGSTSNVSGGSFAEGATVKISDVITSNPTKDNYLFDGWTVTSGGVIISNGQFTMGTANVVLTANWTEKTDFTVTYDANGGSGAPSDNNQYESGDKINISSVIPTRSKYTFTGWKYGNNTYQPGGTFTMPASDVTFVAQWNANNYTITFNAQDGTMSNGKETMEVASDDGMVDRPENPERTGYTFMGWYKTTDKSTYRDEFDFDLDKVSEDITLYALWFNEVDQDAILDYIEGHVDTTTDNSKVNGEAWKNMVQGSWVGEDEKWRGYFNYVNGIFLNSLVNLSYNLNEDTQGETIDKYQQFVVDYLERYIREDGTIVQYSNSSDTPNPESASQFNNIVRLDFLQTTRVLFDAYEFSGDDKFLRAVEWALTQFANDESHRLEDTYNPWHTPDEVNEVWLDGLYMYAPLYARYLAAGGKAQLGTTDFRYTVQGLIDQYAVVVNNMRDSDTGLYYHGYSADGAAPWANEDGVSSAFWSRGTGWLAMSLVDVLDYLPDETINEITFKNTTYTSSRAYLTAVFKDLMDSILAHQDPDSKMFYHVLNQGTIKNTDNYLETSGSAMFAYALMKGGKAGYLSGTYTTTAGGDPLSYNDIGRQVFEGIYAHSVSVSGSDINVYDICGATSLSDANSGLASTYVNKSAVANGSKGTAPFILAFIEYFNETVNKPTTPNVNERQIPLDANGGTLSGDEYIAAVVGNVYTGTLPTPTRDNYDFTGWYIDAQLTTQFVLNSTIITSDMVLYAGWELEDSVEAYTFTLDANGGSFAGGSETLSGIKVAIANPELLSSHIPSREHYDFAGFASSENATSADLFDANGDLIEDAELSNGTIYAVWTATEYTITIDFSAIVQDLTGSRNNYYNITYDFNGNTGINITAKLNSVINANFVDGFNAPTNVARTNYTFIAWIDQDGVEYAENAEIHPTKDMTLKPVFQIAPGSISSRVSASDSTVTWNSYTMDSDGKYVTTNADIYQNVRWTDLYADYLSDGYYTIIDNTGVTVKFDSSKCITDSTHRAITEPFIRIAANSKDFATIVIKEGYTAKVTVYGTTVTNSKNWTVSINGSTGDIIASSAFYTETNLFKEFTPGSYTTSSLSAGTYTISNGNASNNGFITGIKVELSKAPTFTVSFEENGGTSVSNVSNIAVGGKVSEPTAPTKTDYTFGGWYLDSNLTKAYDFNTVVTNDTTLYAKWNATGETPDTYTVTYNANGGANAPTDSTQYSSGDTVTISSTVPTRTNYIFAGWTSSAFSGTKQAGETFTMPENNVTLTASWTATYSVTYVDGVDGEEISMPSNSNRFKEGVTFTISGANPSRLGYTFAGWESSAFDGVKQANASFTMPASDVTLTATWNPITYNIAFNKNNEDATGEMSPIVATYGQATALTQNGFTLEGYTFKGWATSANGDVVYLNGESVENLANTQDATVTLYAVWEKKIDIPTEIENFIIYKNGEQLTVPNSQGIEVTFHGLSNMAEERTDIVFGSGDLQTGTVIKTGGSSKSTRYISFKVPSSVYSSFKVKVVGTPSSNGQINIWVSKTIGSSMGNGETAIITPSVSNTYLTGTSGSFDTADENGDDITYYLNFSSGARFYEISLELTTEINTDVERTISFVTDDNDARPFDGAIADQKVENGGSLDLTAIVPTTSSKGYVFSHWVDSLGNVYTDSIDNVLRDMTLYAKWYTVVDSADTPESTRGKVPLADAKVYGLYLPSTTTIRLANGSTASWTVDWDYVNATYATELDGNYTAKNISNYANIDVAGFYKVTGTISVPSGYLYEIGEVETSTITVESIVEVYVIGAQVMAGAGYMSDGRTAWNSGLTLTNDRYTLSENGEVSIVVDADNIGEITSDGIINLTGATFSNSSYKNDAPIKIDLPNEYSMLLIVIKVTNATKDNVSLWTEDGIQVPLSQTVGATYTNLSISTTDDYGNILYLFSSGNNTALHSIVVNAQYEDENINDENIEDSTNKLYYHTVINDNNSYGEAIEEPYNYLNQAKVIVKPQTEHLDLPDHYLFSRWATATSGTASYYNPGDVLTVTSETNNLYVIMEEEPKITITFDVNAPAGMTSDQISQVFGSFALEYKIYSGDSLDSMPDFSEVRFTVNGYEYTFDGWSPSITQDTTFNEDTTVTANWYTATLPVIVKDLEKTVQEGTTESEIINSLPTEFVVCDINGNETSDYDYAVIVGSWTSVAYNANVAGTYIFRATLDTAPSGTVWYSSWAGVEIDSQAYDRSQDGTYYVYCKVTVVEAEDYATYSAEFTAFAYTGSGDHVLYNNNSNTHDKAWSDYYQVATDEATIPGTIVARNGEVKIIADDETVVDEDDGITAALVDTDYHGQTWSMIKGYHQTSLNAPFIYVVVPKGYASVKISVYAVRFRASGNDVTLEVGPLNSGKDKMLVTDHSYTETDNETDFNYFYEFSPSYHIYEYSGDETVFTVRNTHRSTNIYLTGIKVECTMVEDESHIITYHANDGTDNALTREVVYAENGSGDDAIVEKNFFEREGYEFIGWSRTKGSDSIEQNYQVGKSLELDGNITLYAVWQRARALTYYANDGSTDSFTKYYTNGRGPLSENEFDMTAETREDKVFLSWNTQSNGQGDTYYPGDIFNPNASDNRLVGVIPEGTVLYAQWGSGKTLTAKWDAYSSELQAIDTVYTDCSQTLGNDWTTKYNGKIIAKNGDVLTIDASGATAGSNAMSKPMLSLAKGNTISVNVSGITTESALSIRVSAVVASGSSKFTINGTEYSVSRTFDDGSTFTPFVADIAVYATTVSEASTINITTTGNSAIYIVGISASVSNDQFVGNTLTYNNNIEGAEETYDYLVSGSTIVDINHFHRDGYTFAGWATTEGGAVAYTYGQELTVSEDITLYAKWTPITYNYEFISNEATHDGGTFNLVDGITKPSEDPTLNGYIFMGWYLDDGVFQNQATFDGENKFYPSFEMIDGDTIYLYAYFIEDIHTKEIVTPNELQDLEKYIVDVMENVYREEGSTSGTAIVSASALELPANVMVTGDGFGKNLAIDWSLAVSGWTLSSLQSGTQTLTGYIKLDDSDYGSFAFSDGVNENLQQIGVTLDLTLRNIIIQFTDNEPLVEKNFIYPIGTTKSAVISAFEVRGYYIDRSGVSKDWIPDSLVWTCDNFNKDIGNEYVFTTTLYADIGYAFITTNNEDETIESNTYQASAHVTIQDSKNANAGVGFERKDSSDWTQGVAGDLVIDSNGDVGNQLVLTGLSNSYANENGYLTLDAGENALKISIPNGVERVEVKFVGGVRTSNNSSTLSVVDASGNSLATSSDLAVYTNAELATLSINTNGLTELFVKSVGDETIISKLLINAYPVKTTSDNIVKVKFVYAGVEKYLSTDGSGTYANATPFVKSAKIELPTFAESGLNNAPAAQNIEFIGWSIDQSAQVASYQAGGLYDIDLYSDVIVEGNEEKVSTLYAVFNVGYYTLTFDSGFGNTVEYKIPKNKQVNEVITIRGVGREQALKDLELSRVGYNFVDWYYSNGEIFSSNIMLNDHVVVTADWTPKTYTINYKNGNELITTDMVSYTELFDAPVLAENPSYINTTRTFRTWTYNGADWNFGQASLESSGIITDNDIYEIDLQADFGAKVTFKTEYAEVVGSAYPVVQDSNVYPIGYRYALTDKFTNLMGYTFVGWSLVQNSPTAEYTTESVITLTENITLFAVWRANEYKITFESGNANIDFATLEVEGKTLENNSGMFTFNTELPTITATANGYVIHSWYYIDSQGFERTWVFDGDNPNKVMALEPDDETFTLYARWGITVNFEKFSVIANDDEFNQNADLYDSVIVPVGDAIPFVHTQGTASLGSALHVRPQIPGYSFVGWYTDNEGAQEFDINQAFTIDFINSLKANSTDTAVTIYAGFEKVTGNVVITFVDTFDTGATMPVSVQHANSTYFTVTAEYILPDNTVAEFEGWSLYPDGSGEIYGLDDEVFIEGDTVLYAFWTISITDIEIDTPTVRSDETIQVQIPYALDGINGEKVFESVFEIKWKLAEATNADDPSDETIYDLTMGAHNVAAGRYSVPVELVLESGYVWNGSNLELLDNGHYATTIEIIVLNSAVPYYIVKIYSIEDTTALNSDYRLDKVKAEISTNSTADSGTEITLAVTWNSQIDTTIWGTHYVLGSVHAGSYELKVGVSQTVSATIEVTKNGEENAYLYKTYQDGTMPNAPDAPSGFEFLCWTDKGVTAVGQNGTAPAGEWTAMYTKLSFTEGGSIRLNKDYTGIRFTAHLEFYGTNYVAELMKNKSNLSGAVSVTMNFNYEKDGTTYNVGTGQDFMNMTQSVEAGNAIITFSGVISDLVVYDNDGNFVNNDNCDIEFTPIAKVKLNGAEADSLTAGFSVSASHVASAVIGNYAEGTYQHSVLLDYTK